MNIADLLSETTTLPTHAPVDNPPATSRRYVNILPMNMAKSFATTSQSIAQSQNKQMTDELSNFSTVSSSAVAMPTTNNRSNFPSNSKFASSSTSSSISRRTGDPYYGRSVSQSQPLVSSGRDSPFAASNAGQFRELRISTDIPPAVASNTIGGMAGLPAYPNAHYGSANGQHLPSNFIFNYPSATSATSPPMSSNSAFSASSGYRPLSMDSCGSVPVSSAVKSVRSNSTSSNGGDEWKSPPQMQFSHGSSFPAEKVVEFNLSHPFSAGATMMGSSSASSDIVDFGPAKRNPAFPVPMVMHSEQVALTKSDIDRLLYVCESSRNVLKGKRDKAMLLLLLDMKFACQRIADMRYADIMGLMNGSFHGVFLYENETDLTPVKGIKCHPITAEAIMDWVNATNAAFHWDIKETYPLFVSVSQSTIGRYPPRIKLKRDAISKVFTAIRMISGVGMTKEMVNRTSFAHVQDGSLSPT